VILDDIVENKRAEVAEVRRRTSMDEVRRRASAAEPPRPFAETLAGRDDVGLIAEIKHSSPSAGLIRSDFDPAAIASDYQRGGAAALSVLTDERYFGGRLEFICAARDAAELPVLRKEFIIDEYQVIEARAAGADAILLIVRILSDRQLAGYLALCGEAGMAALVEVHDRAELDRALAAGAETIGVNNRDLDTLEVDLGTTEALAGAVPDDRLLVSESGVASRGDVERLAACGVQAVLIGQAFMQAPDLAGAVRELAGVPAGGSRRTAS
jgi:indole-3-glycerol phosphate synthase